MNWSHLFVVCAVLTWARSLAQVCPPNICEELDCRLDKEDCRRRNGLIHPTGGFCGCCPACLTQLKENEKCVPYKSMDPKPNAVCSVGLICDQDSGKCLSLNKCGSHQNMRGYNASCEDDYTFSLVQCSAKSCWCSGPKGEFLGKKTSPEEGINLGCGCSLQQMKNKILFGHIGVYCDDDGNFKPLQCFKKECFCVDTKNGSRKSNVVHIDDYQLLNCD